MADEDEVDVVGEFDPQNENEPLITERLNDASLMHCDEEQMAKNQYPDRLAGLDEKSKSMIQNMLKEERLHGLTKISTNTGEISPNKAPWSDKEQELFLKGMEIHGRKWSKIARMIGTRSVLQVRNFARQYLKKKVKECENINLPVLLEDKVCEGKMEEKFPFRVERDDPEFLLQASEVIRIQKEELEEDEEDIEIEDDQSGDDDFCNNDNHCRSTINKHGEDLVCDESTCLKVNCSPKSSSCFSDVTDKINGDKKESKDDNKTLTVINNPYFDKCNDKQFQEHVGENEGNLVTNKEDISNDSVPYGAIDIVAGESLHSHHPADVNHSAESNACDESTNTNKNHSASNKDANLLETTVLKLIPPQHEVTVLRDKISDEEKQIHHEFFEDRPPKTAARYLKIRNYILEAWEKSKPNYLNKTSVRSGLRNCGDVNCIGRIHSYLEMIGAINFGCEQACYNRQANVSFVTCNRQRKKNELVHQQTKPKENKRLRKRKLLDAFDLGQEGGYTIQHKSSGDVIISPDKHNNKEQISVRKPRNPFKLIPYAEFNKGSEIPYEIDVFLEAVITMDLHAHCSRTEIIGLLGGHYDSGKRILHVKMAEPCQSLSTSMQCEMDPVSQTVASEFIQKRGLNVVGWYHSHPTFPPNPSLRDLETQAKYQEWFSQRHHPFIAIIINPYNVDVASKFRFMIVGQDSVMNIYKKPYRLDPCFISRPFVTEQCLIQAKKALLALTGDSSNFISLRSIYKPQPKFTYLEKMLKSIEHHINQTGTSASFETFLEQLESLILKVFEDLQNDSKLD